MSSTHRHLQGVTRFRRWNHTLRQETVVNRLGKPGRWQIIEPLYHAEAIGLAPKFAGAKLDFTHCGRPHRKVRSFQFPPLARFQASGEGCYIAALGEEVGYTPLPASFIYDSDREIRVINDGDEAETFVQTTPTPARDSLPLDFFVENPRPSTLRDEDAIRCRFPPRRDVDEILQRAEKLRTEVQTEGEPRLSAAGPGVVGTKVSF